MKHLLVLILLITGTGLVKGVTVKNYRSLNMSQSVPVPPKLVDLTCKITDVNVNQITLQCVDRTPPAKPFPSFRKIIPLSEWPAEAWEYEYAVGTSYLAQLRDGEFEAIMPSRIFGSNERCIRIDECRHGEKRPAHKCSCPREIRGKGHTAGW